MTVEGGVMTDKRNGEQYLTPVDRQTDRHDMTQQSSCDDVADDTTDRRT